MPANERRDDDPTTDPGVLAGARDLRDDSAWGDLFRRYEAAVRRYCRGAGAGMADAEELAQQVWLKLVRGLPGFAYDPSRSFRGWLRKLADNAAADHFRRLARSPAAERLGDREPAAPREPTTALGPSRGPRAREAASVEEAVRKRVAPASWELFRRCALGGERISDVAREMGKEYAAAYMAVERVRRKLREEGVRRLGGST
jgi:RNA polymerase sigma-70 factor (ECF subfamily)